MAYFTNYFTSYFDSGTTADAGSRRRYRHIYRVRIDDQLFECASLAQALDLLAKARDFAHKHAQALSKRSTGGERPRPLPLSPPRIEAPPELQAAVSETQAEIDRIYAAAQRDAEIAGWFAYAQAQDEDVSILLLM